MPETRVISPGTEIVECPTPTCDREGPAEPGIYVCGNCGCGFVVERGDGDA